MEMNFAKKITKWYLIHQRDFPWRKTKNPYYIWLSEIILQQTRTEQGLPYYLSFVKNYPSIFDLAKADEDSVLKLWQGLGYYSRARNLHFSAKLIVSEYNGVFPNSYKTLLNLKGVGDYTASAIASICYDEKTAVVDGNVYRVFARYFGIKTAINSTIGIKEFKKLAQSLLPKSNIGLYNQAIMDFGATICTPKKAKCTTCIFNDSCFALQKNKVTELPIKIKKTKIKNRFFNYLVLIDSHGKTCLNKRTHKGIWQNLFEFPLLETSNEINEKTLIESDFFKELTLNKRFDLQLFNQKIIIHKLSHQHLYTKFWIIKLDGEIQNSISVKDLKKYPISTLTYNFLKAFHF